MFHNSDSHAQKLFIEYLHFLILFCIFFTSEGTKRRPSTTVLGINHMIVVSYIPATFVWKPHRAVMYVAQNIWNEEDFQETFHSEIDLCFKTDCNSANNMCHNIVLWVHISWLVCQNYESRMYYHNHWSVEAYSPWGILCWTKQNMHSLI